MTKFDTRINKCDFDKLKAIPSDTLLVDVDIDMIYGSRVLRGVVGFGAGSGHSTVTINLIDPQSKEIKFSTTEKENLSMGFFGGSMNGVVKRSIQESIQKFVAELNKDNQRLLSSSEDISDQLKDLRSKDDVTMKMAALKLHNFHRMIPEVQDASRDILLTENVSIELSRERATALMYLCRILGLSGNAKNLAVLERISSNAKNEKLQYYARKAIQNLSDSQ